MRIIKNRYLYMKITEEQKQSLEKIYQAFLHDEKIIRMKSISMHRGSNCYIHSFRVAKRAIKRALGSFRKNINLELVLLGAILHDYYLYDWREDRSKLHGHGKNHPYIASENAEKDFDIPIEVKKIIKSHMWPINFSEYPKTREAKIVSIADKIVSLKEALTSIKFKAKRKDRYLEYIKSLF